MSADTPPAGSAADAQRIVDLEAQLAAIQQERAKGFQGTAVYILSREGWFD